MLSSNHNLCPYLFQSCGHCRLIDSLGLCVWFFYPVLLVHLLHLSFIHEIPELYVHVLSLDLLEALLEVLALILGFPNQIHWLLFLVPMPVPLFPSDRLLPRQILSCMSSQLSSNVLCLRRGMRNQGFTLLQVLGNPD